MPTGRRKQSPALAVATTATTCKEAEYIRKKLDKFQSDVIAICQEYDSIQAKQVKSRVDYLQSEQFNLIKKAVSTITCLEDLVNLSLEKLDSSGKEVVDSLESAQRAQREAQAYKEQLLQQASVASEPGIEDAVRQLSYDLKSHVSSSSGVIGKEDEEMGAETVEVAR